LDRSEFLERIWEAYDSGDLLSVCAWCDCVFLDGAWIDPPQGALDTLDKTATLSHSICPECAAVVSSPGGYEKLTPRTERARA
jgi:hypothetical protein